MAGEGHGTTTAETATAGPSVRTAGVPGLTLRSEFRRLVRHPVAWVLLAAVVLWALAGARTVWQESAPWTADEIAAARAVYQGTLERWQVHGADLIARCEADLANGDSANWLGLTDCDEMVPTLERTLQSGPRFMPSFDYEIVGRAVDVARPILIAAVGLGLLAGRGRPARGRSSAVSAVRSYWTTAGAAAIGGAGLALVGLLVGVGGVVVAFALRGRLHHVGDGLVEVVGVSGRSLVVSALAAAVGVALVAIVRSVPVLTALVALWLVVVELIQIGGWAWMTPASTALTWAGDGTMAATGACTTLGPWAGVSCGGLVADLGVRMLMSAALVLALLWAGSLVARRLEGPAEDAEVVVPR